MTEEEQYQQYLASQNTTDEDAEYQQYLASQGVAPQVEKVVNEMPEGLQGRFAYKNFAANPEAGFNYLQKQNPDFELKKDAQGEVLARRRGTQAYGRLDPKGFDWRDITDVIASDIPAGIAQGAATAGAGLAGAVAGGGVGAVPAAMAGSAVSGAGLEALRQSIGSTMMGSENFDTGQIGSSAAIGAVSPLVFGSGIGAKQALNASLKSGGAKTAQELINAGRGLVGRGYDAAAGFVGPKVGSLISGINPDVIKTAGGMLKTIKAGDSKPEVQVLPMKELTKELPQKLRQVTQETGKRLADIREMIDNQPGLVAQNAEGAFVAPGTIPAQSFLQPFQDLADKISSSGLKTEAQIKDAEALKKVIDSEFKGIPENLTAAQVDNLRKRFKDRATQYGLNYGKTGTVEGSLAGASAIDSQIASAFEQSRKNMSQSLIDRLEAMDPQLAEEYAQLNSQYGYLKSTAKENANKFKTPKAAANTLNRAINDNFEADNLEKLSAITGIDFIKYAKENQAMQTFSKPSASIQSLGGATSTSRTAPVAIAGGMGGYGAAQATGGEISPFFGGALGSFLGATSGSPAAIRKYMEVNQLLRQAPQNVPGYSAMPYMMMNMNNNDQGEK